MIFWPKKGTTHYHAHLELPDKGRAIKELVVAYLQRLGSRVFGPTKRSGPRLR